GVGWSPHWPPWVSLPAVSWRSAGSDAATAGHGTTARGRNRCGAGRPSHVPLGPRQIHSPDRLRGLVARWCHLTCDAVPHNAQGGLAMGRGRAKAKQTKVARRLKYYSPDTDLNAL